MATPRPSVRAIWDKPAASEFGRLMKGVGMRREGKSRVEGHSTFHFIKKSQIPAEKKITCARFVRGLREQKEEKHRTRLAIGGGRLEHEGQTAMETAGLETVKILNMYTSM